MHVDINRLKGKITEKGFTGKKLACGLGINESTYYRKQGSGGSSFTVGEVLGMIDLLELTSDEAASIFFAQ